MDVILYPSFKRLMESKASIQGIYGHMGSGKTGTIALKLVQCMLEQSPGNDGIKRTKFGLIRSDKADTKDMLDAVEEWLPEGWGDRNNSDLTISVNISYTDEKNRLVKIKSEFIGLGAKDDKQLNKQKSKNYTAIWMEEADQFPEYAFTLLFKRKDRYPDASGNPNSMEGFIIVSFNPPTKEHWIYKRLILNNNSKLKGRPFIEIIKTISPLYRRKGAIDENALYHKNGFNYYKRPGGEGARLHKAGINYWIKIIEVAKSDAEIRADVFGEFSPSAYGMPVYDCFDATKHVNGNFKNIGELEGEIEEDIISVSEEYILQPMTDRKLIMSFDWEGHPACLLYQVDSIGRMVVLDEIFLGQYVLTELLDIHLRGLLLSKYEGIDKFKIIGDPTGRQDHSGKNPFEYVEDFLEDMGIKKYTTEKASNNLSIRIDAVTQLLKRNNSVIISPVCKFLIQGLDGEYKWEYKRGGNMELKKAPDKGAYSHICNCFEYGCYDILHQFQPSCRTNYRAQRRRTLKRYF